MSLPLHLRVVVPGLMAGLCLAMTCGGSLVANPAVWQQPDPPSPAAILLVLFGPALGPFAALLASVDSSWPQILGLSVVLMGLIALHPLRPGIVTGVASGVGLAIWFFIGFAIIYSEV